MKFRRRRISGIYKSTSARRAHRIIVRISAVNLSLIIAVSAFSARRFIASPLKNITEKIGYIAAAGMIPDGVIFVQKSECSTKSDSASKSDKIEQNNSNNASNTADIITKTEAKPKPPTAATTKTAKINTLVTPAAADIAGKISTETIGYGGANLALENLHISNNTGLKVDLKKQLKTAPDISFASKSDKTTPQVLILHTHATECYYERPAAAYSKSWAIKSRDNSKNMISVGNVFAQTLEKAGIGVIHDTTQYDRNEYSGSYERCRTATEKMLKKYPSICVVLDLHRDSITYDNGTKLRPVTQINGKTAAQIMICTGSNSGRVTDYDNWLSNFRFACRLQRACETKYKNLARPMYFVSKKYNHDLCSGSLLIEIGSEANALDEAKYSAELCANALIDVLKPLAK